MKFARYWLPLLAYAGLIFGLSSIPGDGFPPVHLEGSLIPRVIAENPDKILHVVIYAILGWLTLRAVRMGSTLAFAEIYTFLLVSTYGATDELHQFFVPKRSCDLWDWVADSVGGFIAILILSRLYAHRARLYQNK